MSGRFIIGGVLFATIICLLGVAYDLIPMGVPGEWVFPHNKSGLFSPMVFTVSLSCWLLIAFVAVRGSKNPERFGSYFFRLLLIISLSCVFDYQVLRAGRMGAAENLYAFLDPFATGYFEESLKIEDTAKYLAEFQHKQAGRAGKINHLNVHPPGRTLLSCFINKTVAFFPSLCSRGVDFLPEDFRRGFDIIDENKLFETMPMSPTVKVSLVAHFGVFLFLLALGKLFIGLAVANLWNRKVALRGALLYCFVPSPILFFGHYDCYLGSFTALIVWLTTLTLKKTNIFSAAFLGGICVLGIFQSVGVGIPCLWVLLYWLFVSLGEKKWSTLFFKCYLPYMLGMALAVLSIFILYNFFLPSVILTGLANNELFFSCQANRSLIWKLVNPLEFLVGTGIPVALLLLFYACRNVRQFDYRQFYHCSSKNSCLWAAFLCFCVLLFTPTRAEVSRQWCLAWPLIYLLAIKACSMLRHHVNYYIILSGLLVAQIFVFRFFLEIVLINNIK